MARAANPGETDKPVQSQRSLSGLMIEVETLHHVSLSVTDIDRAISVRERPHNQTPWPQIYLTDPDGNVIELNAERLD